MRFSSAHVTCVRLYSKMAVVVAQSLQFVGTECRTVYINRKYSSGWVWMGVTSVSAGMKLSWSHRI
jgi:hypothetical protein